MSTLSSIGGSKAADYSCLYGRLRLGLCCINSELQDTQDIFCSRTMAKKNFTIELAQERALKNIADITPILKWNAEHQIYCFRLSSELFPRYTDPDVTPYTKDFARTQLLAAGDYARSLNQRLLCHPGQYNVVGTPDREFFVNTGRQLQHEAEVLDLMGIDDSGILIVHIGGVYGDKPKTKLRWIQQFQELPANVRSRLAIENCEKNCSVLDGIEIAEACGIPMVFDLFHYACYTHLHPKEAPIDIAELFPRILKTWGARRAIMHISEQAVDWEKVQTSGTWISKEQPRIGAHSDYIREIPTWFLDLLVKHEARVDLEVEAKAKEKAIIKLYELYPQIFSASSNSVSDLTAEIEKLQINPQDSATPTAASPRSVRLVIRKKV